MSTSRSGRWGGLLRASVSLGPWDGHRDHRDLLWVWGSCHIDPAQLYLLEGLEPEPLGGLKQEFMGLGLCLGRSLAAEWKIALGVRVGTGLSGGCCLVNHAVAQGKGSGGRADRMNCMWR